MKHLLSAAALAVVALGFTSAQASEAKGFYMEARTCQVYTGPCFANAEVGLAGKSALMAWCLEDANQDGVDLSGLKVVVVVNAKDTLGFGGIDRAGEVKSVILVDQSANEQQRDALVKFAKAHSGKAGDAVVRVAAQPIEMTLELDGLRGNLTAGKEVELVTRAARKGDCICSNESAYYPPLAKVDSFAPGVAIEGSFKGRGLGSRWSIPDSRSVYMGMFSY